MTDRVTQAFLDVFAALMKSSDAEFYSVIPSAEARIEARAEAKGMGKAVVMVLQARGIALTEVQRERISGCRDLTRLQAWVERAATAEAADELFG